MSAVYVSNIVINAGTDFSQTFTLESSNSNSPLVLSGYTVEAQMRKWSGSSTYYTFTTSIVSPSEGKINILLDSSITSTIKPGRYIYDILITNNSITTRVIEGMVLVREGATR